MLLPAEAEMAIYSIFKQERMPAMRPDIQVGARFPNYALSDQTGKWRKLSELQGIDPLILVLSRGSFCPKERRQLQHLVEFYPELKVGYAQIVTISTDGLLATNEFRDGLGAQWPFLLDPERIVQKDLDIQEYTDPHHDPMIPHTIVLEPELKIFKIYNGYWYWGRPSVEELRMDLREITRKIRPDWDITESKLLTAWERGAREELFYPYGTPVAELFESSGSL
jgi:peroxiredoxin